MDREIESRIEAARRRRPYVKPEIRQVKLRPDEAVLGNCKTNSSAGPAASACTTFLCSTNGS
jgi:hypothetical protein